jgi:glycosyltransferase involved in cell wall biosynthesis
VFEVNYEKQLIYEMHEYPEHLALNGHDIHCLHFPENHPSRLKTKFKFSRTSKKLISGRVHKNSNITLITPLNFGGFVFERYIHPIICIPIIWRILRGQFDAIVLYSAPTNGWQTVFMAKILKIPVIFRAIDILHLLRSSVFWRYIKMTERYVYKKSDAIVANSGSLATYISNLNPHKVEIMYPPLDLKHLTKIPPNKRILNELKILDDNSRNIVFLGTLYKFSGLITCIEKLIELDKQRDISNVNLIIYGDGELRNKIEEIVIKNKFRFRIIMTGRIEYSEIPNYLSIATVAINPFNPELITDGALPQKVLQYMACGIPTISTNLKGLQDAISNESKIIYVEKSEDCITTAINLLDEVLLLNSMSESHLEYIHTNYARRSDVGLLYNKIQELKNKS